MRAVRADPDSRDNNLNLVRLVAAAAVMVSHAWPIVHGPGTAEPLERLTGHTLGTLAVMVFFGLSGFLVTASWHRRPDPLAFAARRARRILPALWVVVTASVVLLGPVAGALPVADYWTDLGTWRFLVRNALLMPVEPVLPGVFAANPYPAAAGSIWTLHYEALCYVGIAAAGAAGVLTRGGVLWIVAALVLGRVAAGLDGNAVHPRVGNLLLLGLPFALGSAAWFWRAWLPLSWPVLAALAGLAWLSSGSAVQPVAMAAAVAYATLLAGFTPCRWARAWNRCGDYSYGVYLYAFPVQGLVQHLWAPATVGGHLLLAAGPVLVLAVLSWRLVERPWLTAAPARPRALRIRPSWRGR